MFRRLTISALSIVLIAAALRFLFLGDKPPHFDEGVNGLFASQMTKTGFYRYDPANFHGPLLFYVLVPFQELLGRHAWALRLPIALVSTASLILCLAFARFVGTKIARIAALGMAVSAGFTFYGRYAIHESFLVLFLLLTVLGAFGLRRFGTVGYLVTAVIGVTGLVLTKETYILHLACMGLAAACAWGINWLSPAAPIAAVRQQWTMGELLATVGTSAAVIVFFYSGATQDFSMLKGLYLTFSNWFETGTHGNGHEKPMTYWLALLLRYEWPALAGAAGAILTLRRNCDPCVRILAIYGGGTLAAYSLVAYKTPWCIISIIWPFFFVLGDSLVWLSRNTKPVVAAGVGFALIAGSLATTTRLTFFRYTDESEPYVYVQTYEDVDLVVEPLLKAAALTPECVCMKGAVIMDSTFPLPWLLEDFTQIEWLALADADLAPADSDMLLVDDSITRSVERRLTGSYFKTPVQLRHGAAPATLYLSTRMFRDQFGDRVPEFREHRSRRALSKGEQ